MTAETGESRRTPGSVPATPVLDATYLATRPSGAKEGVLLGAWGYTDAGERVLLDVSLGQRERTRTGWRWDGA